MGQKFVNSYREFTNSNQTPIAMKTILQLLTLFFLAPYYLSAQPSRCDGTLRLNTQSQVNSFACTSYSGNLVISGPDISDLTPLASLESVDGMLMISNNPGLASLGGLEGLASATSLTIQDNPLLTDIGAITGLEVIHDLNLVNNPALEICNPLQSILPLLTNLYIWGNAPSCLPSATECLPPEPELKICTGDILIGSQAEADTFSCEVVTGNLTVTMPIGVIDISGWTQLRQVWKNLNIGGYEYHYPLDGLQNLDSIGGYLQFNAGDGISYSADLSNLASLKHVKGIRGLNYRYTGDMPEITYPMNFFQSTDLYSFFSSDIPWLARIPYVDTLRIGGLADNSVLNGKIPENGVFVSQSGNHTDLSFLAGVTTLNELTLFFGGLTTLSGIESVTTINGDLQIEQNPVLTDCCPVYDLLTSGTITGSITIENNGAGCTLSEILLNCAPSEAAPSMIIYPNPGDDGQVNVRLDTPLNGDGLLYLLDDFGNVIREFPVQLQSGENEYTLDLGDIDKGSYIIRIVSQGKVYWARLLK